MNFTKTVRLKSDLSAEAITSRLSAVTETFRTDSGKGFQFEGKVSENNFRLFQTEASVRSSNLRPEINGSIESNGNQSVITITLKLPNHLWLLLAVVLVVNSGVVVFLYYKPQDDFLTWQVLLGFILATLVLFYLVFQMKIRAAVTVLKRVLVAE